MNWNIIRRNLSQLSRDQLIIQIRDLYQLSEENKRFLEMRFNASNKIDLSAYKKNIASNVCPEPPEPLHLSLARKAISEFKKAVSNDRGTMELMVYYVEQGTEFILMYGDIDEAFYSSLESMFRTVLKNLKQCEHLQQEFLPRLAGIVHRTSNIGWGFHDYLYGTLNNAFPKIKI